MAITPFKSSDNFNMAGFNEKIAEANNLYYDYLTEFNIPRTINCILKGNTITSPGTAIITNYIGYSIVKINVTEVYSKLTAFLMKDNNEYVVAGFNGAGLINIVSGATGKVASVDADELAWIRVPLDNLGETKYLFPFNCI